MMLVILLVRDEFFLMDRGSSGTRWGLWKRAVGG